MLFPGHKESLVCEKQRWLCLTFNLYSLAKHFPFSDISGASVSLFPASLWFDARFVRGLRGKTEFAVWQVSQNEQYGLAVYP
jgi:hypothetical protein